MSTPTNPASILTPPTGPIMAIAAHPNDIESWCAGTLAGAIDRGAEARVLLVTSGDKGSRDLADTPAAVAARREEEAREAARLLGLADIAFLRYLDGEVENTAELRRELVAWIRHWRPEALFTFDPEHPHPPYIAHRDHRIVGRATIDAAFPIARDPLYFPEQRGQGLHPHEVRQLWLFASTAPTHYVDIRTGLDRKIAARLAHLSQTSDPAALETRWRTHAADIGRPAGLAAAEVFAVLLAD